MQSQPVAYPGAGMKAVDFPSRAPHQTIAQQVEGSCRQALRKQNTKMHQPHCTPAKPLLTHSAQSPQLLRYISWKCYLL